MKKIICLLSLIFTTYGIKTADWSNYDYSPVEIVENARGQFEMLVEELRHPNFRETREITWEGKNVHPLNPHGMERLQTISQGIVDFYTAKPISNDQKKEIRDMQSKTLKMHQYN